MALPGNARPLAAIAVAAATLGLTAALAAVDRKGVDAAAVAKTYGAADYDLIERGRYVAEIGGCHDCHTPGYVQAAGKVPANVLLVGDKLGWKGPWGTTYPTNLRHFIGAMTEKQWVAYARKMEPRPPMPWFNVRAMKEQDLVAIYRYVKALGPGGEPAPAFVPPGRSPAGAIVQFPL